MADTVRESIIKNVKTTLDGISIANGYNNDFESIQRYDARGNTFLEVPLVIIGEGSEDNHYKADPLTSCVLTVYLILVTRHASQDATASGALLNSLLGDLKKALAVDVTRGGKAVDTQFKTIEPFEVEEGNAHIGLLITLEIEYRHLNSNPETAR